ncbi:MAG: hypothetical protein WCX83_01145 [Candidatus Cloacimonas sp.]|jgi:hypothetical protein|nr:hypothetical protein [Candidatus Cloacimonadota bacterium]
MNGDTIFSAISYENLLKLGYGVIDARYCEYDITKEPYKFVIVKIGTDRDSFYIDMMKKYYPSFDLEKEIYEVWSNILAHKIKMSQILKRDISIKVAVYDYFESNER